jgi:hypothetical protein
MTSRFFIGHAELLPGLSITTMNHFVSKILKCIIMHVSIDLQESSTAFKLEVGISLGQMEPVVVSAVDPHISDRSWLVSSYQISCFIAPEDITTQQKDTNFSKFPQKFVNCVGECMVRCIRSAQGTKTLVSYI